MMTRGALERVVGLCWAVGAASAFRFARCAPVAPATSPTRLAVRTRMGFYDFYQQAAQRELEQLSLPIFDPLGDEIPFPFPADVAGPETMTYTFNRPAFTDMLRDVEATGFFGHLVQRRNGTDGSVDDDGLVGAIGCTCQVLEYTANEDGASGSVTCTAGERFEIVSVESVEPYAVASVRKLVDKPYETDDPRLPRAMEMEGEAFSALLSVINLARELEKRDQPASSELSGEGLRDALQRVDAFREKAMQCPTPHLRHEYLGLLIADLLALSFEDRAKCFAITDCFARLEALLTPVQEIEGELRAMLSLVDKPKVARPIETGQELEIGACVEYYETETGKWHPGTLAAYDMTEDDVFMWDVQFDDGHEEQLRCDMQTRHRWRIVDDAVAAKESPPPPL